MISLKKQIVSNFENQFLNPLIQNKNKLWYVESINKSEISYFG